MRDDHDLCAARRAVTDKASAPRQATLVATPNPKSAQTATGASKRLEGAARPLQLQTASDNGLVGHGQPEPRASVHARILLAEREGRSNAGPAPPPPKTCDDGSRHLRWFNRLAVHLDPRVRVEGDAAARLHANNDVGGRGTRGDRQGSAEASATTGQVAKNSACVLRGLDSGHARANPQHDCVSTNRKEGPEHPTRHK